MSRIVILPEGFVIIHLFDSLESHHCNSNVCASVCASIEMLSHMDVEDFCGNTCIPAFLDAQTDTRKMVTYTHSQPSHHHCRTGKQTA